MADIAAEQHLLSSQAEVPEYDPSILEVARQQLRADQNLIGGIIAGSLAAVAGAAIWAVITVATGYQIGWMAVGVGLLVAKAIKVVGKGLDKPFAIAGAVLALTGCLLGNLFTVCHYVASANQMGILDVITHLTPEITIELMWATFSPMDVLFYGLAVYEGFKLSTRQLTPEALVAAIKGPAVQRPVA